MIHFVNLTADGRPLTAICLRRRASAVGGQKFTNYHR
jgi:hypothetical protein